MTLTGARESELLEAVDTLLDARRTSTPIGDLPVPLQPSTMEEVYFVQDRLIESFGEIGGWKVGAPNAEATPIFAPMPLAWMGPTGSTLAGSRFRYRGLEAEVAFLLGADLPARATPYTHEEVYAAVASCHPAIEVLESGLIDPTAAAKMSMLADMQMHGGFVFGPGLAEWRGIDFKQEDVVLTVDGSVRAEKTGSNTAGDLLRLLPWLANEGASRTGGLRAGQWVTTGSWTGNLPGLSASTVDVHFHSVGRVSLRFA